MLRLTSSPIRSISSNGPMRKPPPTLQTRSMAAASATPSPSIRRGSSVKGRARRLARKPGLSLARIGVRPIRLADLGGRRQGALGRVGRGDHLDQLHQRRRVEEVHADHPLGVRRLGGDRGDRREEVLVARIVSGPQASARAGEQLALQLQLLGRRLDHQIAAGEVGEARGGVDQLACRLGLRLAPQSLRGALRQVGPQPLDPGAERLWDGIVQAGSDNRPARRSARSRRPSSRHRRRQPAPTLTVP